MRAMKFRPQDYLQRFADGVAFYDGLPYRVMIDGNQINLCDLHTGDYVHRNVQNDEKLDVSSPVLGYINTKDYAVYMTRIPRRRYKQCVDNSSIHETILSTRGPVEGGRSQFLFTKSFFNSYAKPYPNLREALTVISKGCESVAISRDFAITIDDLEIIKVWYKNEQIGWIDPGNLDICKVPDTDKGWLISYYLNSQFNWEVE